MTRSSLSDDSLKKSKKKFTLRELGGAFGDWGTLIPFIIGYISIVGLNPAGIFICLGLTNIILGIKFNLPLPVQPQKTIGTIALSQRWNPSLVVSTGFGTGLIWMILGLTKRLDRIVKKVPIIIVRGIQLGLGLILGWNALILASENIILALLSVIIILILAIYDIIPSAIFLVVLGIMIMIFTGSLNIDSFYFSVPQISFYIPNLMDLLYGMIVAGIGQFFLTLTNVMIATIILARDLFPDQSKPLNANSLSLNMGIMNIFSPFFGGIPLCHGSGGLAAQYAFGARTGGSMILEGIIEIIFGVFFSHTLLHVFGNFPAAIFGSMLLYTAFLLAKVSFKNINKRNFMLISTTAIVCFFVSISVGFLFGLVIYLIFKNNFN